MLKSLTTNSDSSITSYGLQLAETWLHDPEWRIWQKTVRQHCSDWLPAAGDTDWQLATQTGPQCPIHSRTNHLQCDTFHITAEYTLNSNTNVATYVCWQLYGKIIIYYCYYYYYLIFTPVLERPRGLKANVKNRKMPESANRIYPQWVCGRRCLISIIYQIITKVNKLCTFFSLGMTRTKHFLNTGTSTNCTCKRFVSQQAIISSLTNGGSWALLRKSAVKSTKLVQPFYVNQAVGLGDLPRRLHAQFVAVRQFSHWQALPSFKKCQ